MNDDDPNGLAARLLADENGAKVRKHLASAQLTFILAYMAMTGINPRLAFDFGHACEGFLDELIGDHPLSGMAFPDEDRPPGDDDPRPLYQQLDDLPDEIVRPIRSTLSAMVLTPLEVSDPTLAQELQDQIHGFQRALGLPTREERLSNPDAYPNVRGAREFLELLTSSHVSDELDGEDVTVPDDLSALYKQQGPAA